jgi:hypothetical protein
MGVVVTDASPVICVAGIIRHFNLLRSSPSRSLDTRSRIGRH